jgi:hypothetical protein
MVFRRALGIIAGLLAALPALAEPPPALIEAAEEAARLCTSLGGDPTILATYETTLDLNGDGIDDFVTDLARLECGGARDAFCGPSGCPVTAWLSEPGGYARFDFGRLRGFEIREAEPLPMLVARYTAAFCDDIVTDGCTRTWTFTSNAPEQPPVDVAEPEAAPVPEPAPAAEAAPPALAGWTLRRVPGASPVALGMGTGNIATLAAFCLEGQPFLALTFHQRPDGDSVALGFAFSQGPVDVSAGYEETAGGAFVVALEGATLAARLAGRDTEVAVSVDGRAEGTLSLAGSTKALRGALADCHGF